MVFTRFTGMCPSLSLDNFFVPAGSDTLAWSTVASTPSRPGLSFQKSERCESWLNPSPEGGLFPQRVPPPQARTFKLNSRFRIDTISGAESFFIHGFHTSR